jgi:hypothetical protein
VILVLVMAIIGLALSILAHGATFFPAAGLIEQAWLLNVGLCAVWIPLLAMGTIRIFDITSVGEKWTTIPRYAPEWAKGVAVLLLIYAVFNFLFTMIVLNQGAYPAEVDGRYVLHTYNFGVVLKELSQAEYLLHQAYTLRASSGHWIFLFYLAALGAHSYAVGGRLAKQAKTPFAAAPRLASERAD